MRKLGGRYRLDEPLGAGGMAVVWRGFDLVLQRPVAVKLLASGLTADPASRERIRAEAHAAAALKHPNVADVYDFGQARAGTRARVPYLVMELVDGETLAARLAHGPLPHWRIAVRICAEVAAALATAHARGVVHRDVKPANIMLTPSGAKVVDFGVAAVIGAAQTDRYGALLGTPSYLAPERLLGDAVVPATDVYSLGLLLYHCLAGRLPWQVETAAEIIAAHRSLPPEPLPPVDGLPGDVADLCEQCLRKDPTERPTSLLAALLLGEAVDAQLTLPPLAGRSTPVTALRTASPTDGLDATGPTDGLDATGPADDLDAAVPTDGLDGTGHTGGLDATDGPASTGTTAPVPRRGRGRRGALRGVPAALRSPALRRYAAAGGAAVVVTLVVAQVLGHQGRPDVLAKDASGGAARSGAVPGCDVSYAAQHRPDGSFTADLAITNTGRELPTWLVGLDLPGDQHVTGAQGASWLQTGGAVTLRGDGTLPAGRKLTVSFEGTYAGAPDPPAAFSLNGAACARITAYVRTPTTPSPGAPEAPDGYTDQVRGPDRPRPVETYLPAANDPAHSNHPGGGHSGSPQPSGSATGSPSGGSPSPGNGSPTTSPAAPPNPKNPLAAPPHPPPPPTA